jgi:hypothetical protein
MKSIIVIVLLCGVLVSSCDLNLNKDGKSGGKAELKRVTVNDEFSLGVPAYMTKATSLNDNASLQFQNIFKEAYVIVIDEDKEEFIKAYEESSAYDTARSLLSNYSDIQVQLTTSAMDVISRKELTTMGINGLRAETTEIDATVEGIDSPITYFLTFVEGDEKFYFIMAWTLQDKKDTHRATFEEIANSFRLIKK